MAIGTTYTCYSYAQVPNFILLHSTVSRVRGIGDILETNAPNDPKMTLNIKRSKVQHIHVTTAPKSQILPRFTLRSTFFELQAILRQVHRMIPK